MKIQHIPTSDISVHPALKAMPRLEAEHPKFAALCEDIRTRGIDDAIKVDSQHRVVDGRHRFWAARRLKLPEVPCRVVADSEVQGIIVNSLLQRRHYTKGQLAYLLAPHIDAAFKEGRERNMALLKAGGKSAAPMVNNAEIYAEQIGVSRTLLMQARRIHELFAEHFEKTGNHELKEQFEPQILAEENPIGLGACIAGIGGKVATDGKEKGKRDNEQLELFSEVWSTLEKRLGYWTKLSPTDRDQIRPQIVVTVSHMSADLRSELRKAIDKADKEARAAA